MRPDSAAEHLLDVLDQERALLLAGDFPGLERLADRKQRLVDLMRGRAGPRALADVAARLERNGALLDASRRGLIAARDRLREIRATVDTVSFYAPDGRRETHVARQDRVDHRA